jgi:hypothetical protein
MTNTETKSPRSAARVVWWALGYSLYALVLLASLEFGARAFWWHRGVRFLHTQKEIYLTFYPEMRRITRTPCQDCFDILLLGASVLNNTYGSVEAILKEELTPVSGKQIRVDNIAMSAQTSLDSYYKYRRLKDKHYDLVIDYDGINEVRTNAAPSAVFKSDYSHYSWYKSVNDFEKNADDRRFVLSYTLEFAIDAFQSRVDLDREGPRKEWLDYGCQIKSAGAFRQNLERIVQIARERQDPILLMTNSYYIPEGYTEAKFKKRALDYTRHLYPVEIIGKPVCVAAGIDAHNAVIRDIAKRYDNVLFVDQAKLMPHEGIYFNDMCHFTTRGCQRFVSNMLPAIRTLLKLTDTRQSGGASTALH